MCLENAESLLEDAELLLQNGRYARAYTLAHLACEEMGKIPMFATAETLKSNDNKDWNKFWGRFKSHRAKYIDFYTPDFLMDCDIEGDADIKKFMRHANSWLSYEKLKQYSLYVDFVDGKFISPGQVISRDSAESLLELAKNRLVFFEFGEVSTEITINITHHINLGEIVKAIMKAKKKSHLLPASLKKSRKL